MRWLTEIVNCKESRGAADRLMFIVWGKLVVKVSSRQFFKIIDRRVFKVSDRSGAQVLW